MIRRFFSEKIGSTLAENQEILRPPATPGERASQSESKSNLWSLIDFTLLKWTDSLAGVWIVRLAKLISMSHSVSGGPDDVNMVDLQLGSQEFCNKSAPSVTLPPFPLLHIGKKRQLLWLLRAKRDVNSSQPWKWLSVSADAKSRQGITDN